MKPNYNFIGEAILNEFTLQKTTSSDVLDEFSKVGWLSSVFVKRNPDKRKSSFVAYFTNILAN